MAFSGLCYCVSGKYWITKPLSCLWHSRGCDDNKSQLLPETLYGCPLAARVPKVCDHWQEPTVPRIEFDPSGIFCMREVVKARREPRGMSGWGTWIRTRTNGVRVRGSTVNLFPSSDAAQIATRYGRVKTAMRGLTLFQYPPQRPGLS